MSAIFIIRNGALFLSARGAWIDFGTPEPIVMLRDRGQADAEAVAHGGRVEELEDPTPVGRIPMQIVVQPERVLSVVMEIDPLAARSPIEMRTTR